MSKSRDIADSAATINYIDGLTSDAQSQLNDKATLDGSPTFTGTVTATAFSGDGSGLTGVDSLPSQTGQSGKFLTTDGTDASWDAVDVSSEITGTLPVANGGTGATTLAANNVLLGNGTSSPLAVAPSTSGNVLTSNGTTWESTAPAGGGAWELLATVTVSTGASSLDIASLPSGYSAYKLIGSVSPTIGQDRSIFMRVYSGATLISSGYNFNIIKSDTSSVGRVYSTSSSAIQLSSSIAMSWAYPFAFEVDLINPTIAPSGAFSGLNTFSTILFRSYGYSTGPITTSGFAGVTPPTASSPINGYKLYWNGTDFNGGYAYVYGLKES